MYVHVRIYLFAIINPEKLTIIFDTFKWNNSKKENSDKNPWIEKSIDHQWQRQKPNKEPFGSYFC